MESKVSLILSPQELEEIGKAMKKEKWGVLKYSKKGAQEDELFSGHNAIKWITRNADDLATSKKQAKIIAQRLMDASVFHNVNAEKTEFIHSKSEFYLFNEEGVSTEDYIQQQAQKKHPAIALFQENSLLFQRLRCEFVRHFTDEATGFSCPFAKESLEHGKDGGIEPPPASSSSRTVQGKDILEWLKSSAMNDKNFLFSKLHESYSKEELTAMWTTQNCKEVLEYLMMVLWFRRYNKDTTTFSLENLSEQYEIILDSARSAVEHMKSRTKSKRLGQAFRKQGRKPIYPVILLPGLASSALEILQSQYEPSWEGDRIWLDITKIGEAAHVKRLRNVVKKITSTSSTSSTAHRPRTSSGSSSTKARASNKYNLLRRIQRATTDSSTSLHSLAKKEEHKKDRREMELQSLRMFLYHLCPDEDGYSDPPGVCIRPAEGLRAIDYLSHSALTKKPSYVFGPLIQNLYDLGYTRKNLAAAPYDWRIPPAKLEERDGFFTTLQKKIEAMKQTNGGVKVVVMGHSMGNRTFQYFAQWVETRQPGWCKEYIEAWMALGAPLLGAPKVLRALVSGDAMGLDMFLLLKEAADMTRRIGSVPSLLPIQHQYFPQEMVYISKESNAPGAACRLISYLKEEDTLANNQWAEYQIANEAILSQVSSEDEDEANGSDLLKLAHLALDLEDGEYPIPEADYAPLNPTNFLGVYTLTDNSQSFKELLLPGLTSSSNTSLDEEESEEDYSSSSTISTSSSILGLAATMEADDLQNTVLSLKPLSYGFKLQNITPDTELEYWTEHHTFSDVYCTNNILLGKAETFCMFSHNATALMVISVRGEFVNAVIFRLCKDLKTLHVKFVLRNEATNESKSIFRLHTKIDQGKYPNHMVPIDRIQANWTKLQLSRLGPKEQLVANKWLRHDSFPYPDESYLPLTPELVNGKYRFDNSRPQTLEPVLDLLFHSKRPNLSFEDINKVFSLICTEHGIHTKVISNGVTSYSHRGVFNAGYHRKVSDVALYTVMLFGHNGTSKITINIHTKHKHMADISILRFPDENTILERTIAVHGNQTVFVDRYSLRIKRKNAGKTPKHTVSNVRQNEDYFLPNLYHILDTYVPEQFDIWMDHYVLDPLFLSGFSSSGCTEFDTQFSVNFGDSVARLQQKREAETTSPTQTSTSLAPILDPPPLQKIWAIYGVNLETEVSHYFTQSRVSASVVQTDKLKLDKRADKHSQILSDSNPAALVIRDGIGYETSNTAQRCCQNKQISGDGTVPYCSLSYVNQWEAKRKKDGSDIAIRVVELEKVEHRAMLSDDLTLAHILSFLSTGEGFSVFHSTT